MPRWNYRAEPRSRAPMRTSLRDLAARCLSCESTLTQCCATADRYRRVIACIGAVSPWAWTPDGLPNAQQEKAARPGIHRSKQIVNRHVDNNNGSGLLLGRQKEIHDPRG